MLSTLVRPVPALDSTRLERVFLRTPDTESRLTTGTVRRNLLVLALPILAEQLLNTLVGLFDTFLAGRLSVDATVAIGLAVYVSWLAHLGFALVGAGTTALVSRTWGAGKHGEANELTNRSITLSVLMGVAGALVIFAIAPGLVGLQNMTGTTYAVAVRYLQLGAPGHLFTSVTLVASAALRGVGDTRTPMWILVLVNLLNVAVSVALVFGLGPFPELGVDGIVIGTLMARTCGGLLLLGVLARGRSGLKLRVAEMGIRRDQMGRILRIGLPAAANGMILWFGQFLFLMIIARLSDGELGRAYYAAHIIAVQVEAFTYLPAVAWGTAAATMVGQALGARSPRRAKRVGHEAMLQASLFGIASSLIFFFGADWIYHAMHKSAGVQAIGARVLPVLAFFELPLVISIVYVAALRGAGDTRSPLWFTVVGMFLLRLPLAYLFGIVLEGGLLGAWIGMFADTVAEAILAATRYQGGAWVHTRV